MATYAITGAASGMGAATRTRLEADGHEVIGIDLHGTEIVADLATIDGRAHTVAAVTAACGGRLDGLVTAAGVSAPVPGDVIARVNYFGSHALLEGLRPCLAAADEARVVQLGSNSITITPGIPPAIVEAMLNGDEEAAVAAVAEVEAPFDSAYAYAGSKLAITRWCRRASTTAEWIGEGIRLNVLAPGMVDTPLLQAGLDDETYGPLMERMPVPTGAAQPDELARWIEFMLGPAARFACGSVIMIDGGSDALLHPDR